MKKIRFLVACSLFCLLASTSQAFALNIYGFGSYWEMDELDGTMGAGVGVNFPFILERLLIDGRAHYFEDSEITHAGSGDTVKVIPFDLGLQFHILPDAPFDPYVMAGISYNYVETEHVDLDSTFGGYLGGGVDISMGVPLFKIFGEFLYRYADIDNVSDGNYDTSGFTGNIGLKFHF